MDKSMIKYINKLKVICTLADTLKGQDASCLVTPRSYDFSILKTPGPQKKIR